MQREIILDAAEQCAARSTSSLSHVERALRAGSAADRDDVLGGVSAETWLLLGLCQQLEAIRLTLLAGLAPEVNVG